MNIKVLLADVHAMFVDSARVMLDAVRDITVVGTATNGRQAVRLAIKLRPDVAVLDISLHGLNGIDAAHQIVKLAPSTKVVVLSTHSSLEFIYRSLGAGARGYVLKEANGPELIAAIRAVHGGKRHLPRKITMGIDDAYIRKHLRIGPLASLTVRERHVLQLVVEGNSSAQAGKALSLSPKTVDTYRSRIKHKLDIHDLPGLVKFAIQHGLTPLG